VRAEAATTPAGQISYQPNAGWGCAAALAYLAVHANPRFALRCPGWADGHQAMTCVNAPGLCPGIDEIVITIPCPAAYENEAWNSWHVWTGPFDPYGSCTGASAEGVGAAPPAPSSPPGSGSDHPLLNATRARLDPSEPANPAPVRLIL